MTMLTNSEAQHFKDQIRTILSSRPRAKLEDDSLICAAVLIPLLCRDGEWYVVVTQRTETVEHHRGQISFPGGACEPGDADLQATALRETHEEIGVPPDMVEVLGALDDFQTITSFVVTPFVGIIPHPFDYQPNSGEVEAVVEVPLSVLLDPDNLRVQQREHEGKMFEVLFWDHGPYTIWGATARMLKNLLDLLC